MWLASRQTTSLVQITIISFLIISIFLVNAVIHYFAFSWRLRPGWAVVCIVSPFLDIQVLLGTSVKTARVFLFKFFFKVANYIFRSVKLCGLVYHSHTFWKRIWVILNRKWQLLKFCYKPFFFKRKNKEQIFFTISHIVIAINNSCYPVL